MWTLVVAVVLVAAGCGSATDRALAGRLGSISAGGCEAVEWSASSEAASGLPESGRVRTVTAVEDEAACGFGTHTWQRTEAATPETSPAAVIVVTRRGSNEQPSFEGDLVAHEAEQQASGAGQAETSGWRMTQKHVFAVAVNDAYVDDLHPERLLEAAERDIGTDE